MRVHPPSPVHEARCRDIRHTLRNLHTGRRVTLTRANMASGTGAGSGNVETLYRFPT